MSQVPPQGNAPPPGGYPPPQQGPPPMGPPPGAPPPMGPPPGAPPQMGPPPGAMGPAGGGLNYKLYFSNAWNIMMRDPVNWILIALVGWAAVGVGFWGGYQHCYLKAKRGEKPEIGDVFFPFQSGQTVNLLLGAIIAGIGAIACGVGALVTMGWWGLSTTIIVQRGVTHSQARGESKAILCAGGLGGAILFAFVAGLTGIIPLLGLVISSAMYVEAYLDKTGAGAGAQPAFPGPPGQPAFGPPPGQPAFGPPPGQPAFGPPPGQPAFGPPPGQPAFGPPPGQPAFGPPPGQQPMGPPPGQQPMGPPPGQQPMGPPPGQQPMGPPPGQQPMGPPPGQQPMGPPPGQQPMGPPPGQMDAPPAMGPPPGQMDAPPAMGPPPGLAPAEPPAMGPPPGLAPAGPPSAAGSPVSEHDAPTVALDHSSLESLTNAPAVDAAPAQAPAAAEPPAAAQGSPEADEEDEFYSGKTQAMELKPALRNADGTYSCAYCNNVLPPDVKATCPHCHNIVIGL